MKKLLLKYQLPRNRNNTLYDPKDYPKLGRDVNMQFDYAQFQTLVRSHDHNNYFLFL